MINDERMDKLIRELFNEEIEEIEVKTDVEELLDRAYKEAEKNKNNYD